MTRVIVTGGAGFIGSHLCRTLLEKGYEVICIDNLYTGSKENIADLLQNSNFEFIKHDITDGIIINAEQIYNLACPASPVHYQNQPIQTIKTSTLGVWNMLNGSYSFPDQYNTLSYSRYLDAIQEHNHNRTQA